MLPDSREREDDISLCGGRLARSQRHSLAASVEPGRDHEYRHGAAEVREGR